MMLVLLPHKQQHLLLLLLLLVLLLLRLPLWPLKIQMGQRVAPWRRRRRSLA